MAQDSMWVLLLSTLSVAFLHALAPDHWMPFAGLVIALTGVFVMLAGI